MRKAFVSLGIVASLSLTAFGVAGAQGFSDTNGHWAQNTIEWGQAQGYVHGYPDGSYKPDQSVSEAEFLSMLVNAVTPLPINAENATEWSDAVYIYANKMNYPVQGYQNLDIRNQPITRTHVAELETASLGLNYSGDGAIKYLLTHGLANGKTASNVEGFQGNDDLTRAEAITFIKNLKDKKQDNGQSSTPTQQTQPSQTPTPTQTTTTTDLSLDQMKDLEMQYANSLSFDSGTLTGTPPVLPSQYEWNTVFSLFKKEDGKLSIVGWNKKLTEGEQFSFPVNWDDIQSGIFRIEIIDKRINVPDVTTLRHYETNQIEQHIN